MSFEDYQTKPFVTVVYTGDGKGKTSASLGLMCRALGAGWGVAYIQFIKHWTVNEHTFIDQISPVFGEKLSFFKGGKGFYDAGDLSAKNVTKQEHIASAQTTLAKAHEALSSGKYSLIICDEINNAVNDGLLEAADLEELINACVGKANLCLTGRNFPTNLADKVDIITDMTKVKHHFDDKFLANNGLDY